MTHYIYLPTRRPAQEMLIHLVNEQIPSRIKEIARAQGLHTFEVGDPAVMLYHHKGKVFTKPVTVERAEWAAPPTKNGSPSLRHPQSIMYTVVSAGGGTMTVGASSLRPGGVLDRIVLGLEICEGRADSSD